MLFPGVPLAGVLFPLLLNKALYPIQDTSQHTQLDVTSYFFLFLTTLILLLFFHHPLCIVTAPYSSALSPSFLLQHHPFPHSQSHSSTPYHTPHNILHYSLSSPHATSHHAHSFPDLRNSQRPQLTATRMTTPLLPLQTLQPPP